MKALYGLETWAETARILGEHRGLSEALGAVPSRWAMYRFARKLHGNRACLEKCVSNIIARLKKENAFYGDNIAIDSTDIPAFANYYEPKGKDVRWGHRTASKSKKSKMFFGYKLHMAVCSYTELPIAWEVRPANENDIN